MKRRHVPTAFLVTCLLFVFSQGQTQVTGDGDPDFVGADSSWANTYTFFQQAE